MAAERSKRAGFKAETNFSVSAVSGVNRLTTSTAKDLKSSSAFSKKPLYGVKSRFSYFRIAEVTFRSAFSISRHLNAGMSGFPIRHNCDAFERSIVLTLFKGCCTGYLHGFGRDDASVSQVWLTLSWISHMRSHQQFHISLWLLWSYYFIVL